jgi:hypothetical protein
MRAVITFRLILRISKCLRTSAKVICAYFACTRSVRSPFLSKLIEYWGTIFPKRILTFYCSDLPARKEDYSEASTHCILEQKSDTTTISISPHPLLKLSHYYLYPEKDEPADGFNTVWHAGRAVKNVKFHNGALEFAFSLVPQLGYNNSVDYTGSATNILLYKAAQCGVGEMLSPYADTAEKRWGQLTKLVFFSLPWENTWFHEISLLGKHYDLVWSNTGPICTVVGLKSEPLTLTFNGHPYFPTPVTVSCNLHRILYVYPDKPYYTEDLLVLAKEGSSLGFRAYFLSVIAFPPAGYLNLARFEHIPDYFAIWKRFAEFHFGYGFAADAHVRALESHGQEVS